MHMRAYFTFQHFALSQFGFLRRIIIHISNARDIFKCIENDYFMDVRSIIHLIHEYYILSYYYYYHFL